MVILVELPSKRHDTSLIMIPVKLLTPASNQNDMFQNTRHLQVFQDNIEDLKLSVHEVLSLFLLKI
jgi:hypothetical protein